MMVVDNEFEIGQTVYHKADTEQLPGIVTQIVVTKGDVYYNIAFENGMFQHAGFELTLERDMVLRQDYE
jgi:hypothetical protein